MRMRVIILIAGLFFFLIGGTPLLTGQSRLGVLFEPKTPPPVPEFVPPRPPTQPAGPAASSPKQESAPVEPQIRPPQHLQVPLEGVIWGTGGVEGRAIINGQVHKIGDVLSVYDAQQNVHHNAEIVDIDKAGVHFRCRGQMYTVSIPPRVHIR